MKKLIYIGTLFFVLINFAFEKNVLSWDNDVTHKDLSRFAAQNSVLTKTKGDYLKKLGFSKELLEEFTWNNEKKTVEDWLRKGADFEDAGNLWQLATLQSRSFNHFHNAIKQFPWTDAGLDDQIFLPPYHTIGISSLLWAQSGAYQENFPEKDWSWQKVREHYYTALTGRNFTGEVVASTKEKRDEYFARTFRGLGHQIHLIEDAAQPDHVRNDAHPEDSMFGRNPLNGSRYIENWAKEEFLYINSLAMKPIFPNVPFNVSYNGLVPITQFIDTDRYDGLNASAGINQGIAEYTNANFFSDDTIFAAERYSADHRHYFPFPRKSSTDIASYIAGTKPAEIVNDVDGVADTGIWISKERDGENIAHFVRPSLLTDTVYSLFGEGPIYYSTFYRDEICNKDYTALLIPRAVGYSAGLLNYFFRGEMEGVDPNEYNLFLVKKA